MPKKRNDSVEETDELETQELEEASNEPEVQALLVDVASIESDESIKLAKAALIRGKDFAVTRFGAYTMYLSKLRLAYERGNGDWFVDLITWYLREAYRYVPQVPDEVRSKKICDQIASLVEKYGVRKVGGCILERMLT